MWGPWSFMDWAEIFPRKPEVVTCKTAGMKNEASCTLFSAPSATDRLRFPGPMDSVEARRGVIEEITLLAKDAGNDHKQKSPPL